MNTGAISSRYAKALLLYTQQTGCGDLVCRQAEEILAGKELSDESVCEDLQKFVALMVKNGREKFIKGVLFTFVRMYYQSRGISLAHLTVASPSEALEERLREVVRKKTGRELKMDVQVDPSLIGGFVFVVDDCMMDASVKGQIEAIRKQFTEKNRTTV